MVKVAEDEAKKYEGKPHCLRIIRFIDKFFEENPLSCCADEVSQCKRLLDDEDKFKLSQKTSSVTLHVVKKKYFFKARIVVPNEYPLQQIRYLSTFVLMGVRK